VFSRIVTSDFSINFAKKKKKSRKKRLKNRYFIGKQNIDIYRVIDKNRSALRETSSCFINTLQDVGESFRFERQITTQKLMASFCACDKVGWSFFL